MADVIASGTNGRVTSSGHTGGGSRYAETSNGTANDRGRTEAELDSMEVQPGRQNRKKEHRHWRQEHTKECRTSSESTRMTRSMTRATTSMAELSKWQEHSMQKQVRMGIRWY